MIMRYNIATIRKPEGKAMTYKQRYGTYEVQTGDGYDKWFKSYDKAVEFFNAYVRDMEDADDFAKLVNLKTGEILKEERVEEAEAEVETVGESILKAVTANAEERLSKLEEIGAPEVVIEGQRKAVENLRNGALKISGEKELLDVAVESKEVRKGNGGKMYVVFNGNINFFPNARYGMFIKRA